MLATRFGNRIHKLIKAPQASLFARSFTLRSSRLPIPKQNSLRKAFSSKSATALKNQIAHANLFRLVEAYRAQGHYRASLDPLNIQKPQDVAELNPATYGLDVSSTEVFPLDGIVTIPGKTRATFAEIQDHLNKTYCSRLGVEASHLLNPEEREWFAQQVETLGADFSSNLSPSEKRNIHSLLLQSETFDHFMGVKFTSFKRYGCEGAESMLPAVETIFTAASKHGVEKVVLGMPHRGRLNLLVSLLEYPARSLFSKVKGGSLIPPDMEGFCDVTSHIATTVTKKFDKKHDLTVSLLHNPSHLEAINPVAQGKARAKQDGMGDKNGSKVMCLQLHGDAAFAGQGVVPESLMIANLPDFTVGGTVHLIVNNQIGFTTLPTKGRSSIYASDFMKTISAPVIHVNGDDPEAVVLAARLAVEYRAKFKKDVLVDLIAFRKHGHNEVDEPAFTQPAMYKNIRSRQSVTKLYEDKLRSAGLLNESSLNKLSSRLIEYLESELTAVGSFVPDKSIHFQGKWQGYLPSKTSIDNPDTGVSADRLKKAGVASVTYPADLAIHPRLQRLHVETRLQRVNAGENLDWATAEAMAFGTLMEEGYNVRISGQDVERGTFSHRHAVLVDQNDERRFNPLANAGYPGFFHPVSSDLSEFAVMGYEFGYSWESPKNLSIWEAQFGDFHNGAQIIIDTFLGSTESKWLRATGMVLLLPHGYDGAGPEHSSGRMERFLQICDGDATKTQQHSANMIVANVTTPANYFHMLRRQMIRAYRKPLVLMAPKTLLRLSAAVSSLKDMAPGTSFQPVIGDSKVNPANVNTVVFCSGKIYYDLDGARKQLNRHDIALIRVEELSPFPFDAIRAELKKYDTSKVTQVVWCQEEPQNAGAWLYVEPRLVRLAMEMGYKYEQVQYIGRPPLPSPAVGAGILHRREGQQLLNTLFKTSVTPSGSGGSD